MRNRLALLAGLSLALAASAAPTRPWTTEESDDADRHVSPSQLPLEARTDRFPDGARGTSIALVIDGVHDPELHPEYRSREEQMLQEDMCFRQAVVLARAHEPLPRLNAAHSMIHSKVDFDVVDVLKSTTGLQLGDLIAVERRGGEVLLNGERLRVVDRDAQPYAEGELYLLLLSRAGPTAPMLLAQQFNVAVRDDRVWPEKQRWYSISAGELYSDVRANLRRLLSFACRR